MALPKSQGMTAEELLQFSGEPGKRYELVDGELIEMAPAGAEHGSIAHRISRILGNYVFAHDLGDMYAAETGFLIRRSPDTLRAPDISFVSKERIPGGHNPEGYLKLAPDFVAEVVSPNDTAREIQQRIDEWLQAGASVVMVVYPESKTVFLWRGLNVVERRSVDEELSLEPTIPGFRCPVAELFPE